MDKFKVGDVVKVISPNCYGYGSTFRVDRIGQISWGKYWLSGTGCCYHEDWLEKVGEDRRTAREVCLQTASEFGNDYSYSLDSCANIEFYSNEAKPHKKGIIMSAVDTVKKLALKATNPDEYQLREAGIHDEDGDLTEQGEELMQVYLEELVHDKLVQAAKDINADKKKE